MKVIRLNPIKLFKHSKQQGIILVLTAISIFALIGIVALATEAGHMVLNKTRIQNIADSAAIAGAKVLFDTNDMVQARRATMARIMDQGRQLDIENNFIPQVRFFSSLSPRQEALNNNQNPKYVEVTLATNLPRFLGTVLGDDWQKNVDADAVAGRAPVRPTGNTCPTNESTSLIICTSDAEQSGGKSYFGYESNQITRLHTGSPNKCAEDTGNIYSLLVAGCPAVGETVSSFPQARDTSSQNSNDNSARVAATVNALFGLVDQPPVKPRPNITPDIVTVDSRKPEFGHAKYTRYNFENNPQGYTYARYLQDLSTCSENPNARQCNAQGIQRARVMSVPIADCNGAGDHSSPTQATVKSYACIFIPQSVGNNGMDGQVFGEFVDKGACDSLLAGGIDTNPNSASSGKFVLFR